LKQYKLQATCLRGHSDWRRSARGDRYCRTCLIERHRARRAATKSKREYKPSWISKDPIVLALKEELRKTGRVLFDRVAGVGAIPENLRREYSL
jgi:hypothetical protein